MRRRVVQQFTVLILRVLCCCFCCCHSCRNVFVAASEDAMLTGGLVWQNVSVCTTNGSKFGKIIVHPFSGWVENGKICGILGPTGSGKTSFLSALAGTNSLPVTGNVWTYQYHKKNDRNHSVDTAPTPAQYNSDGLSTKYTNGNDSKNAIVLEQRLVKPNHVAWLQQQDHFFGMLTVRETLLLAAFLELPHTTSQQRADLVENHLQNLALLHAADRLVGDALSFGDGGAGSRSGSRLSGGERRRLSVALELLTEKELFIADEPTSGLDSTMSAKVMKMIKTLAKERSIPCLCSIHQPRSSIWHALDSVIVIAPGGHVCYAGDRNASIDYFASQGFACPPATNPAEFLLDLISIDSEDPDEATADRARILQLATAFRAHQDDAFIKYQETIANTLQQQWQKGRTSALFDDDSGTKEPLASQRSQLRDRRGLRTLRRVRRLLALLRRSWRQNIRNSSVNLFRAIAMVVNGVLLSQIFPTVRGPIPTPNSVADRVALLSFGAINLAFMAYMKAISVFSSERPVLRREQMRSYYGAAEYLLAKSVAELPLDASFAAIFTTILKKCSGVRISWTNLTAVFSLLTTAGASLGFLVGGWAPDDDMAMTAGLPLVVILLVVGIINPSGVDSSVKPPAIVRCMKRCSPFAYAIEALCLGEYPGMVFKESKRGWFRRLRNLPKMGGLAMVRNGDQVIEELGLGGKTYEGVMKQLAFLTAGNLLVSWLGLMFQHFSKRRRTLKPSDGISRQQQQFGFVSDYQISVVGKLKV